MTLNNIIRVSDLPSVADCSRRWMSRSRPAEVKAAGFDLREMSSSIGAAIGTGTHAGLENAFRSKMEARVIEVESFRECAAESIMESIKDGVIWDDATTNVDAAITQATRQARIIWDYFGDVIEPVAIEERLSADIGDGFILRGHIDVREAARVVDFKTGTVQRANQPQYGGYSLVARSNGHTVDAVAEIYSKRVGVTRDQPAPTLTEYDIAESEIAAQEIYTRMKADILAFRERGDPWVFLPNPNSMNCSENYCPAWGTSFCRAHKQPKAK
ncbi:MAG: PD-(D/E)XK nuclease family protein [Parvibaculum sp.]|nr:PD-(D/E)XK nuclease family protein [Parvibaculum sp.]